MPLVPERCVRLLVEQLVRVEGSTKERFEEGDSPLEPAEGERIVRDHAEAWPDAWRGMCDDAGDEEPSRLPCSAAPWPPRSPSASFRIRSSSPDGDGR